MPYDVILDDRTGYILLYVPLKRAPFVLRSTEASVLKKDISVALRKLRTRTAKQQKRKA